MSSMLPPLSANPTWPHDGVADCPHYLQSSHLLPNPGETKDFLALLHSRLLKPNVKRFRQIYFVDLCHFQTNFGPISGWRDLP